MKRRFTILTAALALLAFLAIPMGMWGQTKTEGFETATASTTYNSTVNITTQQSDCGIAWTIYYGCVSTNNKISGNKSAQMRWYSSATSNRPYLQSTTAIDGLTNVAFKARVGNTNVKMDVHYSSDGNNWTAVATAVTFTAANTVYDYSYTIPSGGKYIKIGVSSSSTAPSSGNYAFIVDDVVFTYSSSVNTYTVTYHANVTGTTDIEVEYNEGDDVTVAANTFTNPGYAFTEWNTSADGTGTSYDPEDVIEDINNDIDLYAQWEESTSNTGTINFGNSTGYVAITDTEVTGNDNLGNEWTITTVGTTYFYAGYSYNQIGSSSKPATSITFTTTLPDEVNVTAMEAKFGGFTGTAGDITMKVGNTTIGTGSLNAGNDVTVNSSSTETGNVLTVTITNISKGVKAYYISYTYEAATPDPAVATTTTITVPDGFNNDLHNGTNAGTLSATVTANGTAISGASVTWTSSNTSVATVGETTGVVTLVAVGTTTITASYAGVEDEYRPSLDTYELTVIDSYAPGTVNNPYTVAQAIANTPTSGDVYIQGIVSSFYNTSIVGDGTNYRYYISDDGTTTTQLLVYKGKGLNQATFTNANDLLVGDEVVIYGSLITYQNAPEVASGNYLYSWNRPAADVEAPSFSPAAGTYTETQSVTISCATTGANIYYTTDGTEPTSASTPYTSAIAVSTTTTIKAIAYVGNESSTVVTATYHFCSADDPYTVTEALAFNEYPANGVYVHGIVSTAPTQNPTNDGELTYYISVDGTASNQLEVYKGLNLEQAAFSSKDDIQVGDIVTVYGNVVIYNSTKEFTQGNYLVSFERPAQQYTLTVNCSANVEIFTFIDPNEQGVEGATTQQVTSGTEVGISVSATTGYILTLMVDGTDVTSQLDNTGYYTFNMPTHDVTITATASAAPVVTTNTYTLATSIESGKTYIIVGKKDGDYYAMGKQNQNNRAAVQIISDGTTATATIGSEDDVFEFVIEGNATDGYTFYDGVTPGYLYAASSSSNYLRTQVENDNNGIWDITYSNEEECPSVVARGNNSRKVMQFNNSSVLFACYGSASQHAVYLFVKDETPVSETFTKTITAYTANDNGWYLIASPIGQVAPDDETKVTHMLENTYDLFSFDQTKESEWQNYKAHTEDFVLEPGIGYLYANSGDVTLTFTGSAFTTENGTYDVELVYSTANGDSFMHGWNLVGNPFAEEATVSRPYYTLDEETFEYAAVQEGQSIEAMEGIFVVATAEGQSVTFTSVSASQQQDGGKGSSLTLNITKGGKFVDRAIVSFSQGGTLPKFQFDRNHTKVYIQQDGQDYAIVNSEEMGAMPVNFKAENDGTYSLSFSSRNAEFAYLHLIDNMTGKDIDLLQTQSYSFEARTTDYESRFKLVFATGDNSKDYNFAFFSNGSFVINNEGNATLQVIDVTGRVISSESVNGCTNVNVNAAPGVYMLRLVNGENVRVQKVVVK